VIQKIEENHVNVIKRLGMVKNGKRYKIHQNRLKFYHASQQKRGCLEKGEEDDESSNDEQSAKSKSKYTKNMNNPRWKNNLNQNVTRETASETESESDFDENECRESQVENEEEIEDDNSLNKLANNNHQESILETPEPIIVTSKKRGRPKKVKVPIDEIIIATGNKSIKDTNNISPTPKTSGKHKLRTRIKQINYKTLRNINEITSNGVELDNDYD
jgi:hypothetical protein